MAGPYLRFPRRPRCAFTLILAPLVVLAAVISGGPAAATDPSVATATTTAPAAGHRWGFGWDPGDSGEGLTVRYEFRPGWDVSVAAGPNDFRDERQSAHWDTSDDVVDDGTPTDTDSRQEQGWVRLAVGRRFWRDGRFAVHGTGAAAYRWSVNEYRQRDARVYDDPYWDWYNIRYHTDRDSWWIMLGIRPSYAVTDRFLIEFESGLRLRFESSEQVDESWWDAHQGSSRTEESQHERLFQSYGMFELSRLRFIFRF